MRILFVTEDFSGASLCARLAQEGHEVRVHVGNPACIRILDGVIEKVPLRVSSGQADLGNGLDWVGKDGLIICDDNGFGKLADDLRAKGFSVVGGSAGGDLLEDDREHAQQVFAAHGLNPIPTHTFGSAAEAAEFIDKNGGEWVVKRNGRADKISCYVGQLPDGSDTVDLLRNDARRDGGNPVHYVLQKRVRGVEIGVARYFNGTDWAGPIELNIEHKKLFPGDLGPKTCEMGTLLWYTADESNRLFREMLAPLKPYLQKINFRGDFDINCIVNEQGAWPLEATARFGYPAVQAQMALHETPWGEFLKAVADGNPCDLRWKSGYAVVVLIAAPPFPFCTKPCDCALNPNGLKIRFREPVSLNELAHYHFEEALRHPDGTWEICHDSGYVLHVTGHGSTVKAAREEANRRAANVVIPRAFYRTDIGGKFLQEDRKRLKRLGYL